MSDHSEEIRVERAQQLIEDKAREYMLDRYGPNRSTARYLTGPQIDEYLFVMGDFARAQRREVVEECVKIANSFWRKPHEKYGQDIATAIREHFKEELL